MKRKLNSHTLTAAPLTPFIYAAEADSMGGLRGEISRMIAGLEKTKTL